MWLLSWIYPTISYLLKVFSDTFKFRQLPIDPTPTRLSTLQNYLSKLLNQGEISECECSLLRSKHAHVGRAHGVPKIHKQYTTLPKYRPIVDTTKTTHYNVGEFLPNLLNRLAHAGHFCLIFSQYVGSNFPADFLWRIEIFAFHWLPDIFCVVSADNKSPHKWEKIERKWPAWLTQNIFSLSDSFQAASDINSIPKNVFSEGH